MDDIYVYLTELPNGVSEMVTPCSDGYTIYLNNKLCPQKMQKAYFHALSHIDDGDFNFNDVQHIELKAHHI